MSVSIETRVPPVRNKHDLVERLGANREAIRSCGARRLQLFGSFARNEVGPESDVDLLVDFEPGEKTWDHFMELCLLLEEILGRRVELVTRESLSPYIGPRILEEAEDAPLGG